jgi:hypothetical protein
MTDSMDAHLNPIFGKFNIPGLGYELTHAPRMERLEEAGTPLRRLIAANISKLLPRAFRGPLTGKGIKEIRDASQIPNGTVGRIVTPSATSWNIDLLEPLAKALGVQPWQLLLPDLELDEKVNLRSLAMFRGSAWPFPSLTRDELADLDQQEWARLEKTIRLRLEELREDREQSASPREQRTNQA